jgi:N-acyl-D-aspartate/D-glutamate deacylase
VAYEFDIVIRNGTVADGLGAPLEAADVAVKDGRTVDVAALDVGPRRVSHDLPADAMRRLQGAKGYIATIVSGVITYRDGAATGELPGRLVRGPQHVQAETAH